MLTQESNACISISHIELWLLRRREGPFFRPIFLAVVVRLDAILVQERTTRGDGESTESGLRSQLIDKLAAECAKRGYFSGYCSLGSGV